MFDDDDRRLVQVASIANAIGAAENASPWRALVWLAGEVEAGTLVARLYIPVRMRTVGTSCASQEEALRAWRTMAKRTKAGYEEDMLNYHLPTAASTWHVHVNDLLQFIESATMAGSVRAELRELAQCYRGAGGTCTAPAVAVLAGPVLPNCQLQVSDKVHKLKRRADPLAAFIKQARVAAADPDDWTSVWAAMVVIAQKADRPPPLLGYTEGEGVKYQTYSAERPVSWLTRDAWRRRAGRAT